MLLRFLRFCLIISLLTRTKAKLKTESEDILNEEMNFESYKPLQNSAPLKNKYSSREINFPESRNRRTTYIKAILSNRKLSSTQILAEKLAKEALKSPEMQEKIRKLTIIKSKKRNSRDNRKNPKGKESVIRSLKAKKGYYKPAFEDPKRKKRKKHKCGFGLGWCSDSNSSRHNSFKKVPSKIREEAVYKREAINPSLELNKARKTRKAIVRESMLQKIMETTTKDPNKKKPVDQGMEYSEYYNDEDEVNNPGVKIQPKDEDFKSSLIRSEREVSKNHQRSIVSLNQDNEFDEDLEDEVEFDGNESDVLLSGSGQNRNENQVYQQNQVKQQRQPNQRNQIYQNIYQDPYLISDPLKYGRVQQQIGLTPSPQFLYPNQYNNQFTNRNQISSPISEPLNQSKKKVEIKNNQNYNENNSKRNQDLVLVKEPEQLFPGIEVTSLNSTSSKSTVSSSTSSTSKSVSNTILNTLSTPHMQSGSQNSGQLFGIPESENTQMIGNKILSKIVDELEELKADRLKKSHKQGRPCRISGSWVTFQGGVKLKLKVDNNTITVIIEKLEPPPNHEGILNSSWNLSGQTPFRHGGPFSLIGVNHKTKSLAVFVGSCRICQDVDTIEGIWTVSREPHGCRDFQIATEVYNDIFQRIRLHNNKTK